jgi:hypothetical protein
VDRLDEAFLCAQAIDRSNDESQRDRIREELTLALGRNAASQTAGFRDAPIEPRVRFLVDPEGLLRQLLPATRTDESTCKNKIVLI